MEFDSETLLLYLVLGMYLFCYFVTTWVWIKSDERNRNSSLEENKKWIPYNQTKLLNQKPCFNSIQNPNFDQNTPSFGILGKNKLHLPLI